MGCGSSKPAVDEPVTENGKGRYLPQMVQQGAYQAGPGPDGSVPVPLSDSVQQVQAGDTNNPLQGMGPTGNGQAGGWASGPPGSAANGNNTNGSQAAVYRSQGVSPAQETVLEVSTDEDDQAGGTQRFDVSTWKRFYTLNKNKPNQLLRFLWKRFNPEEWNMYCITYKHQAALNSPYQGDNVMYGLRCRIEELLGSVPSEDDSALEPNADVQELFGVMHTLVDKVTHEHKVVGVLLAQGDEIGPFCLENLLELSDWVVQLADPTDPCVKTFISQLITSQPPSSQYLVAYTRTV